MTGFRIETGIDRGEPFQFTFNEMPVLGYPGESIAAALLASGYSVIRTTPKGQVRGLYCAMGVCWECMVRVDGGPSTRACMIPCGPGLKVETQIQQDIVR